MVQVMENRTDIVGQVQSVQADPARSDYRIVTIAVERTTPVEGYANMFTAAAGTQLDILVSADHASALAPGKTVRCRIRRGGPMAVFGNSCVAE